LAKEVGVNRTSILRVVAGALLVLMVGGAACGGDKEKKASEPDRYELRASAKDVATGLGQIETLTNQIALAVSADAKAAKAQADGIEKLWQPIEGTIRANDKDSYLRFEDNFAALEKAVDAGDPAKAQSAATDVSAAVKAYVAKYPG
jgi:Ribonuclease G/E